MQTQKKKDITLEATTITILLSSLCNNVYPVYYTRILTVTIIMCQQEI